MKSFRRLNYLQIIFLINVLLFCLPGASSLLASDGVSLPIGLELPGEMGTEPREVEPGSLLSLVCRLSNHSQQELSLSPEVDLPGGWRSVIPLNGLILLPGETENIIIPVHIPEKTRAGQYTIRIKVYGEDFSRPASVERQLRVKAVSGLEITPLQVPAYVKTGSYSVSFRVVNTGNTPRELAFACRENLALTVIIEPESACLQPGEGIDVAAKIDIPTDPGRSKEHRLTLLAYGENIDDPEPLAAETVTTEIISHKLSSTAGFYNLPLELRTAASYGSGINWGLSGSGKFGQDLAERLGLAFNNRKRFLQYTRSGFSIAAGSQDVELSLLVRYSNSPAALNIKYTTTDREHQFTAYLDSQARLAWGAKTSFNVSKNNRLGLQFLSLPSLQTGLWTVRSQFSPAPLWDLELEYGRQFRTGPLPFTPSQPQSGGIFSDSSPAALYLKGSYTADGEGLSINYTLKEKGFHRAAADSRQLSFNFYKEITPDYYLTGSLYGRGEGGASPGSLEISRGRARLQLNRVKRLDDGARVRQRLGIGLERGLINDEEESYLDNENIYQYVLYHYSYQQSIKKGSESRYLNWKFPFSRSPEPELACGIQRSQQISQRTAVTLGFQIEELSAPEYRLSGKVNYDFKNGSSLALQGNVFFNPEEGQLIKARLSYAIPLELPLWRKEGLGEVAGGLIDEKGRGIPGVVVELNGLRTSTAEDGSFYFPTVPAGEYYLIFSPSDKFSPDYITVPETPCKIRVCSGKITLRDFILIKGARIQGKLCFIEPKSKIEKKGKSSYLLSNGITRFAPAVFKGLSVELKKLTEDKDNEKVKIYHQPVDETGNFTFDKLTPGEWLLRVCTDDLPRLLTVNPEECRIQLETGESREMQFETRPLKRTFTIEEGGSISCEQQQVYILDIE